MVSRRVIVVFWILCAAPAAAGPPAPATPDLLGIRRLMQRWSQPDRQLDPFRPIFMAPRDDDVDQLVADPPDRRAESQEWLRQYSLRQVLFRQEDLRQLERQLATLPVAAIHRWWESSVDLRTRLIDEPWQETQQWLQEFLNAQAVYDAKELARFRAHLATLTAAELLDVLDHFETTRLARLHRLAMADQVRQQALRSNRELRDAQRPASGWSALRTTPTQSGFPSIHATTVPRGRRLPTSVYRQRSLSQRVSDYYIFRSIYGNDNFWWVWP